MEGVRGACMVAYRGMKGGGSDHRSRSGMHQEPLLNDKSIMTKIEDIELQKKHSRISSVRHAWRAWKA